MLLDVGMRIYHKERMTSDITRCSITRVTPKQAVVDTHHHITGNAYEIRFDRDVGDGRLFYARGAGSGYDAVSYSVETPELIARHKRCRLENQFKRIEVKSLTDEQLEAIIAVSNNTIKQKSEE